MGKGSSSIPPVYDENEFNSTELMAHFTQEVALSVERLLKSTGNQPTPLVSFDELAQKLDLGSVFMKDES